MRRFIGSRRSLGGCSAVLLGLPMDFTSSRHSGSREAPDFIRLESEEVETYSPYLNRDLEDISFFDAGNLTFPFGDTPGAVKTIELVSRNFFSRGFKVFSIGGDHLVSYPLIKSASIFFSELKVIHLDAHTDLRRSYQGSSLSHASVMRLVSEECLVSTHNLYQFGIRSGTKDEFEWAEKNINIYPFQPRRESISNAIEEIGKSPVYISIDIDVVDPSAAPGTGTPEPGGFTSTDLLEIVNIFKNLNVIGFDLVEISPLLDHNGITSILGAKILREALLQWAD